MTFVRPMFRRLLILLLLLFAAPGDAQPRDNAITPELVAEGPAMPGGEVELAIVMRPKPGWHGYWLNPGDAGLPMSVEWQLPAGVSVGAAPLPGSDPADDRRADELCLRARLCGARPAEGPGGRFGRDPDPRRGALARLHRQDLRSRSRDDRARPAGRGGAAEPSARGSTNGAAFCQDRSHPRRDSPCAASACWSRSRCRAN